MNNLLEYIFGGLIGVIGYFLRFVHCDVRKARYEINRQAGKLELLEQEHRLKFQMIQETTQQEIKNLATNVSNLSKTVERLITKNNEDKR